MLYELADQHRQDVRRGADRQPAARDAPWRRRGSLPAKRQVYNTVHELYREGLKLVPELRESITAKGSQ